MYFTFYQHLIKQFNNLCDSIYLTTLTFSNHLQFVENHERPKYKTN